MKQVGEIPGSALGEGLAFRPRHPHQALRGLIRTVGAGWVKQELDGGRGRLCCTEGNGV